MISGNTGKETSSQRWFLVESGMRTDETCVSMMLLLWKTQMLSYWTIGKVIEVFPGKDSKVRNVRVKTSCGEYERPVNRIAVIYPEEGYEQ